MEQAGYRRHRPGDVFLDLEVVSGVPRPEGETRGRRNYRNIAIFVRVGGAVARDQSFRSTRTRWGEPRSSNGQAIVLWNGSLSLRKIRRNTHTRKQSMAKTRDAVKILDRVTGEDGTLRERIAEGRLNLRVAQMIHEKRVAAGLTQTELAGLLGTAQSVVARLEDADYEGHSLSMLQRIAQALHGRLEVRIVGTRGRKVAYAARRKKAARRKSGTRG